MTIQELFGIELPIVQARMAGVQGSGLAVEVSGAGGLGSLPWAILDVADIRQELTRIRTRTARPVAPAAALTCERGGEVVARHRR